MKRINLHEIISVIMTYIIARSTRTIVVLWTEYRLVIKIGPKGALGSHEIRPIHSAPSLGQSIALCDTQLYVEEKGRSST